MRWSVGLVLLLVTGCGADAPPLPEGLVLRTQRLTGMPSSSSMASLPEFSLYGDGKVIRPGPMRGALRTAEIVEIGRDEVMEFYEEAHDIGLAENQEIPNPSVVDGHTDVFVLNSGGRRFVTRSATPEESSSLAEFHRTLRADGPVTPYRPTRIAAVGWYSDTPRAAEPWPLAPLDQRAQHAMCVVVDAARATALAAGAPQGTFWRSGGATFVLVFRPLLPDESTCGDLDV